LRLRHVRRILLISACFLCIFLTAYISPVYAETTLAYQQYAVAKGDTLWLLSQRYGTSLDKITSLNPGAKADLYPGQALILPVIFEDGYIRYTVQKGDTLFLISSRTGRSISGIMEASRITSDALVPGQKLFLPAVPSGLSYYIVETGDVLWTIAKEHQVSLSDLMEVNRLSNSNILVGQILEIPEGANGNPGNTPEEDSEQTPETPKETPAPDTKTSLYLVKSGDYLSLIAQKFGTTTTAIYKTNKLHSDILMPGQPLFIPQGREAVEITGPVGLIKPGKGEFLPWNWARWVYNIGATATVIDYETGKKFQVRYMGGSNHADSEPLTAQDTTVFASLFPKGWSWATRPVLLQIGARTLAASIAGMPHSIDTIPGNNFSGHFDLYFYNSTSHNTNTIQPSHQQNILTAAGLSAAEADAFTPKL